MTNKEHKITINYAKILFSIYFEGKKGSPADLLSLSKTLESLETMMSQRKGSHLFVILTHLNKTRGLEVLDKLGQAIELDSKLLFFLKFVFFCKRFYLIIQILQSAKSLLFDKIGKESCVVFASHQLSQEQLICLKNKLIEKLDKELEPVLIIKKSLILGLRIMTKSYIFESSFANKLQQITASLNNGMFNEKQC